MTICGRKTVSDERSLLPTGPTGHPMTNPAVPLGVADDQGPFCLWRFSDSQPTDQADNHRRSCSHRHSAMPLSVGKLFQMREAFFPLIGMRVPRPTRQCL